MFAGLEVKLRWAKWVVLGLVLLFGASALFLALSARRPALRISSAELTNVVREVMSVGECYRSPEPNHQLTELAYMKSMDRGRGVVLVDLAGGSRQAIPLKAEARFLFSWSLDDRYLLLKDAPNYNEQLLLYDAAGPSFQPATKEKCFYVEQAAWVGTNRFAYISKQGNSAEVRLVTPGQAHRILRAFPDPSKTDWLAAWSDGRLAFLQNGQIWAQAPEADAAEQLTTNLWPQHLWLNYASKTGQLLFCSNDDSDWRHLFKMDTTPGNQGKVTQLTFGPDHSYNGQWIQGGAGFTYVGNISNHFYLAVRPADPKLSTNLFVGGHVVGYRTAVDGNTLFAAAALGMEPTGIWRYDIDKRALKCVAPGTNRPFAKAQVLAARQCWTESYDHLKVPYYLIEPRAIDARSSYPLVLAVPPESGQFVQAWEKYGQCLANIGAFYAAVNPRGSDGYGKQFRQNDPEEAWRDILAVRQQLLHMPNIDRKRCFLLTWSNGSQAVNKAVQAHPRSWAGVILLSGVAPSSEMRQRSLPPYFIFMGGMDRRGFRPLAENFKEWADTNGGDVTLMLDPKTTHIITDVNVDRRIGFALADFIFHHH